MLSMIRLLPPTVGLALVAAACFGLTHAANVPPLQIEDPVVERPPERVVAPGDRRLSQPQPWGQRHVLPFLLATDRVAAREASLAKRASLRAFEGAPPAMPHSARFGEGSKTCLDCHTHGMRLDERVAHPMSHPPLASCTQCHV